MPELPQSTLDALLQEDWDTLLKRLIIFANRRLQRYRWRGGIGGVIPAGQDPSGIAVDAISDLLAGRYPWQRENDSYTNKELWSELIRLASNRIKGLWSLKENMITESLDEPNQFGEAQSGDKYESSSLRPDQLLQRREAKAALLSFRDELATFLNEPLLTGIIDCALQGVLRREEIATTLCVTPQAVTNARKRLERRLEQYAISHPGCPLTIITELTHA